MSPDPSRQNLQTAELRPPACPSSSPEESSPAALKGRGHFNQGEDRNATPLLCHCVGTGSSRAKLTSVKLSEFSDRGSLLQPRTSCEIPHMPNSRRNCNVSSPHNTCRQLIAVCKAPARLDQKQPEVSLAVRVAELRLSPTLCHCVSTSRKSPRRDSPHLSRQNFQTASLCPSLTTCEAPHKPRRKRKASPSWIKDSPGDSTPWTR